MYNSCSPCGTKNPTPPFPVECPIYLTTNCITIPAPLPYLNLQTGATQTQVNNSIILALQNGVAIDQNNFVRQLLINQNDLPPDYTESDIIDYILALDPVDRTILDTDSKWNIIVFEAGS